MPNTTPLHLDAWHLDDARTQITLLVSSRQAAPCCPGCDVPARSVHSYYTRTLADLPWSGYGATWRLRVRKLFCRNTLCPRRIFTERLPGIATPWARRMRQAQGLAPGQRRSARPLPTVTEVPQRPLTPRRATGLVLRPPERATTQDHHQLAQLTQQAPELAEAVALAQDFANLVRRRQPAALEPWLTRAATSSLPPFRRFARGLRKDYAAVHAAVTWPWSQGPIEGQINRLKLLKHQMFGRARLDLLARRFLLAA